LLVRLETFFDHRLQIERSSGGGFGGEGINVNLGNFSSSLIGKRSDQASNRHSVLMIMVFNFIDCMDMIVRTVFSGMLVLIFMNNIVMGVFMRVRVAVFMRMMMGVFVRVDLACVRMFMIVHM
jgi:hypothetical protein